MSNNELRKTYTIPFLVEHKRGNGPTSVGAVTGLTADTDSGMAPSKLILSSGDGMSGHRHIEISGRSDERGNNRSG